jgi:hypothetical protein
VGSYAVSGGGNRLRVNGDRRSGSGRSRPRSSSTSPAPRPWPHPRPRRPGPPDRPPPRRGRRAHDHDPPPRRPGRGPLHPEPEGHQHHEGLFGLTIPLLDEPLDARYAIGFAILAVLIALLCYTSVRIDRRYQRRIQQLREQRASRQAPPPPPPAYTYGSGVDDWWDQSSSRWSSDTPSWP